MKILVRFTHPTELPSRVPGLNVPLPSFLFPLHSSLFAIRYSLFALHYSLSPRVPRRDILES